MRADGWLWVWSFDSQSRVCEEEHLSSIDDGGDGILAFCMCEPVDSMYEVLSYKHQTCKALSIASYLVTALIRVPKGVLSVVPAWVPVCAVDAVRSFPFCQEYLTSPQPVLFQRGTVCIMKQIPYKLKIQDLPRCIDESQSTIPPFLDRT